MDVVIGVDPHKHSHTAVALDPGDNVLGELRVDANSHQVLRPLSFAAAWPQRTWAVENANGLGRLLSRQLVAAGETVVDVPAKLSARVRTLSGAGHKTDAHDARSTAVAGRHAKALRPVVDDDDDDDTVLLGVLLERRWQLVSQRQKTLCRIHDQLVALLPGGARRSLSATKQRSCCDLCGPSIPSVGYVATSFVTCSPSCASSTARSKLSTPSSTRRWTPTAPR